MGRVGLCVGLSVARRVGQPKPVNRAAADRYGLHGPEQSGRGPYRLAWGVIAAILHLITLAPGYVNGLRLLKSVTYSAISAIVFIRLRG